MRILVAARSSCESWPSCSLNDPRQGTCWKAALRTCITWAFGWLDPLLPFRVLPVLDRGHVVVVDASVHGKSAAVREKKTTNEFSVFKVGFV